MPRLITLEAAKAELGVTGTADDARLGRLVDRASAAIVSYLGRDLARADRVDTALVAAGPHPVVLLSLHPVATIAAVTVDTVAADLSACDLDAAAGILWLPPLGCATRVTVTYTAGYVLPGEDGATLPADIEGACLDAVRALWSATGPGGRDPMLRSESVQGVGATSWQDARPDAGGLPPQVAAALAPYRRVGA